MPTPSNTSTKDYELLKHFLRQAGGPKEGDGKEAAAKKGGAAGKDGDGFPDLEECIMIFGGSDALCSKSQHKVCYREACAVETAVPSFLSWLDSLITFDQRDHPSHVMRPGCYPLQGTNGRRQRLRKEAWWARMGTAFLILRNAS